MPAEGAFVSTDAAGAGALFDRLYTELQRVAQRQLAREHGSHELDTTTLLHETYLAMSHHASGVFADSAHFLAYASRVMRSLVIDGVRRRSTRKRGGECQIFSLEEQPAIDDVGSVGVDRVRDALDELARVEAGLAQVVELRFFRDLSFAEVAARLSISERTAQRRWEKARSYLKHALQAD